MLPYLIAGAIGFGIGKLFENGGETFMTGGQVKEEWKSYLKESRVDALVKAGYSKNVAKNLSSESWDSLEKQVQNAFKNVLISEEVESMKSMMESLYTYGGLDKDNRYLEKYKISLGNKLFNKTFDEYRKELEEGYDVDYGTYTDSEGWTYNSLRKTPIAFVYREIDDPNVLPERFTPEEVIEFIGNFNQDFDTNYKDWQEFNKGEEYRKFEPIMLFERKFENGGEMFMAGGRITTNEDVLNSFLTSTKEVKVNNLSTHFNEYENLLLLRNYGTIIAGRYVNTAEKDYRYGTLNFCYVTKTKYSQTTTKILNKLKALATKMGYTITDACTFDDGGEMFMAGGMTNEDIIFEYPKDSNGRIMSWINVGTGNMEIASKTGTVGQVRDGHQLIVLKSETPNKVDYHILVDYLPEENKINMVRGKFNSEPSPKYQSYINDLFRMLKISQTTRDYQDEDIANQVYVKRYLINNFGNPPKGCQIKATELGVEIHFDSTNKMSSDWAMKIADKYGYPSGNFEMRYSSGNVPITYVDTSKIDKNTSKSGKGYFNFGETFMAGGVVDSYSVDYDDVNGQEFRDETFDTFREAKLKFDELSKKGKTFEDVPLDNVQLVQVYKNGEYEILDSKFFGKYDNGGEADDKYGGQRNKIVTELKSLKGGLNNKAPYVFVKEGYIYVSAENGDNYADYYEYTIDEKLEDLADRYNTYWDWETAGSIVLAPIDTYGGGGLPKKRRISVSAQYGRSDTSIDKQLTAKPVGYRFTNAKANQLRKDPFAKPTEAQVKKYLGKGIYKENRKNRSDRDRNAKL